MKTLHLLRHAKAKSPETAVDDFSRTLNPRGERAARAIAEHVAGWSVDLVVCSPAARARATAAPVVEALGCPVRYEDSIYEARPDDLLLVTRGLSDDAASVMLVGHNPTFEDFTALLCGSSPEYPTGALGTLSLAIEQWSDAAAGCATLDALFTPAR
jgi:phosphohistidine phosphatase